jgi:hypothetical protein
MLFNLTLAQDVAGSMLTGIHIAEGNSVLAFVGSALTVVNTVAVWLHYTEAQQ